LQAAAAREVVGHQEIDVSNSAPNRNAQTKEKVRDIGGVTFKLRVVPPNELQNRGFERSRHFFLDSFDLAPRLLFFQIFVSTDLF
jgi:hypothetical protein